MTNGSDEEDRVDQVKVIDLAEQRRHHRTKRHGASHGRSNKPEDRHRSMTLKVMGFAQLAIFLGLFIYMFRSCRH